MTGFKSGISILEVILAAALFAVFSTAVIRVMIQSLDTHLLAGQQAQALGKASEGLEALYSIANRSFSALSDTVSSGLSSAGGQWNYSGTGDSFDIFTRTVSVSQARRDSSGNYVNSGGLPAMNTKKVVSTVNWTVMGSRGNSIVLSGYFSDWRSPVRRTGLLVYGDGGTSSDAIRFTILDPLTLTWSPPATVDVDPSAANKALRSVRIFSSRTRNEKIMLSRHYNGSQQQIFASVYNGSVWGNIIQLSSWSSSTLLDVRNFDGAYQANGSFMAVYSDNTTIPKVRVWNSNVWGTAFSAQNIGGIPVYVTARARPGTNEVMTAYFDAQSDTNTQYFNGGAYAASSWSLHPEHSVTAPMAGIEYIDFTWNPVDPLKGALIYTQGNSDKNMNIRIFTANGSGSGSWSALAETTNQSELGSMQVTASAASTYLACDKDSQPTPDIYCFTANDTPSWSSPVNNIITTGSDVGFHRSFDVEFEPWTALDALVVYSDNTTVPKFRSFDSFSGAFSAQGDVPALGAVLRTVRLEPNSSSNDIMSLLTDNNQDLYTFVWDGVANAFYSAGNGYFLTPQGVNGSSVSDMWYDFAWDNF